MCTPIDACVAPDLSDQQDHRRRILPGRVQTDGGMRDAGTTCHEAHTGPPGQLADRLCHIRGGRFMTTDDGLNALGLVVKRIEYGKKTFTGHAEDPIHPVMPQRVGKDAASAARARLRRGFRLHPALLKLNHLTQVLYP